MDELLYFPPVDQLLTLGEPVGLKPEQWTRYDLLGISSGDVPQLICLLCDEELNSEEVELPRFFAQVHAWRALGQMKAIEAVDALLDVLDCHASWSEVDEWCLEDMIDVLRLIGPDAVPAASAFLVDPSKHDSARSVVAESLAKIAHDHPDCREHCVGALVAALDQFERSDSSVNSTLVAMLLHLKAMETAPLLRRVFRSQRVDKLFVGDWGDARRGLKLEREEGDPPERPPGESIWKGTPFEGLAQQVRDSLGGFKSPDTPPQRTLDRERTKARAQRKQKRQSRRQNRRRR
jgi:hypothetical protein